MDAATIIREWTGQLQNDKLLRAVLEAALEAKERTDVEVTAVLRTSGERAVMQPKISIRR